jgi:predicted ribosomally synthesized peptide with nif11-like leader
MSEEQLTALLSKLKEDAGLREKFQGAIDIDAAMALAKEAGFQISKADYFKYLEKGRSELADEELEVVTGGWFTFGCLFSGDYSTCNGRVAPTQNGCD